jgi:hypothetical protein
MWRDGFLCELLGYTPTVVATWVAAKTMVGRGKQVLPVAHILSVLLTIAFLLMTGSFGAAVSSAEASTGGEEGVISLPLAM